MARAPDFKRAPKHITKDERAVAAKQAVALAKKVGSLGEAAETIAKQYGVSPTTARSWIRRGLYMAKQAKEAKDAKGTGRR